MLEVTRLPTTISRYVLVVEGLAGLLSSSGLKGRQMMLRLWENGLLRVAEPTAIFKRAWALSQQRLRLVGLEAARLVQMRGLPRSKWNGWIWLLGANLAKIVHKLVSRAKLINECLVLRELLLELQASW